MARHRQPDNLVTRLRRFYARLVLCRTGIHHASRGQARMIKGEWHSVCRNCGAPMRRLAKRKWELIG